MFVSSLELVYVDNVEFCRAHLQGIHVFVCRVTAEVSRDRRLNWQAPADLYLFCNVSCVPVFILYWCSCIPVCLRRRGFENIAADKLRCESAPSLSAVPYTCSMWPATVVLWAFWFFLSSCARYRYTNNEKAKAVAKTYPSLQCLIVKPDCETFQGCDKQPLP